jgi:hypothetical protein
VSAFGEYESERYIERGKGRGEKGGVRGRGVERRVVMRMVG